MATSQLNSKQIPDNLSIATVTESSALRVPAYAILMRVSSDTAVFYRLKTGENGFRIPANWIETFDVTDLRGKDIYFYNGTGGTAVVTVHFDSRNTQ